MTPIELVDKVFVGEHFWWSKNRIYQVWDTYDGVRGYLRDAGTRDKQESLDEDILIVASEILKGK